MSKYKGLKTVLSSLLLKILSPLEPIDRNVCFNSLIYAIEKPMLPWISYLEDWFDES